MSVGLFVGGWIGWGENEENRRGGFFKNSLMLYCLDWREELSLFYSMLNRLIKLVSIR